MAAGYGDKDDQLKFAPAESLPAEARSGILAALSAAFGFSLLAGLRAIKPKPIG